VGSDGSRREQRDVRIRSGLNVGIGVMSQERLGLRKRFPSALQMLSTHGSLHV
jgi:hypothetical protein